MKEFYRVGVKIDGKTKYYSIETWDDVLVFLNLNARTAEHISIAKQKMFKL